MKLYVLLILVLVCAVGCGSAPNIEPVADAMEMYGPHDIRFETGSVPGSFRVYRGKEDIGSTGSMTPEEWLGWAHEDDYEDWVQANKVPAEPVQIDILEVDLDSMSLTGMDVRHTMQVEKYYALPGDTSWAKIHFKGWQPPLPKHAMDERIPLLGPEGNPNVILMKFNDGEYEPAYIAAEDVRKVVRQVLAEEDLPPLRVVVGVPRIPTADLDDRTTTLVDAITDGNSPDSIWFCDCPVCVAVQEWAASEEPR